MKLSKLFLVLVAVMSLTAILYAQDALVSFRTGEMEGPWCPILLPDGITPLPDSCYIMIILAGPDGLPDPPGPMGEPTDDDVQPTGNNIDHLIIHPDEPPFVPPGNFSYANPLFVIPPPGFGVEPVVNQGDAMYLRAFNSNDPATSTHAADIITVDGISATTYTHLNSAPAVVIVCFGEMYTPWIPCVAQEAAGPEGPVTIQPGESHYFFGETADDHCTLWITAGTSAVTVTATLYDMEPPCKPFPSTTYMSRLYSLKGSTCAPFDIFFGYSQSDYDLSDFGVNESLLHMAWYEGDTTTCSRGRGWVKHQPTIVTDTPEGGWAQITTGQFGLWSYGWGDGDMQLPVELVSFDATAGDREITLTWETASETNNDCFYIERSTDSEHFIRVSPLIPGTNNPNGAEYTYTDTRLNNRVTYTYQLIDVDINGVEYAHETLATATPSFMGEAVTITEYKLHQNYPNPFNPTTTIVYDVPKQGHVILTVHNLLGRAITTLVDGVKDNGRHFAVFNAQNLSSGVYFYTIESNEFSDTKKMLFIR